MHRCRGFSLVEVTLGLGIIGFALLAVFGLLPVGAKSGREAVDSTRRGLVATDIRNRVRSAVTAADFPAPPGLPAARSLQLYYDRDGRFVDTAVAGLSSVLYLADVSIGASWSNPSAGLTGHYIRPVSVTVRWPVNVTTGAAIGDSRASFTFSVRRP